ncbi:hypothetical protein BVG16_28610 [Paenibacillus selenitireducens]|jgi:hypothetical protein|uniref:Phosphate transport regulator n=1 Tax=Paenibacillus selenitireducens TaxID=1324314 RepID=A0A1T2X0V8_9BACL|nr:DUF47 family protein [Paenibacillus selenitireducens]OPA73435.1 hypothetical protein BVG16_28610 [Paenibacillus selenitireducens]
MFKKNDVFFQNLQNMADAIVQGADVFAKYVANPGDTATFTKQMKELESKCDVFTHTIIKELNKTFITPIEREDIMSLATSLDDVLDGLEACASRFDMYHVKEYDESIDQFGKVLLDSAFEIQKAIRLLSQKKLLAIREHSIRINDLENQADDILRKSVKELFVTVKDPIELIKKKEIYERLEETTDACEDVANILETIIMRNS